MPSAQCAGAALRAIRRRFWSKKTTGLWKIAAWKYVQPAFQAMSEVEAITKLKIICFVARPAS
jgi:hypothetical protein